MITANLIYDHRDGVGKPGGSMIEIRVTYNRKTFYISTGIKVLKRNFIGGTVVNQIDCLELNERLRIIYNKVQESLNYYIQEGIEPDVTAIRRGAWNLSSSTKSKTALLDFVDEQLGMMNLAEGTLKHYKTLRTRLGEYGQLVTWKDVTTENLCKFDAWLHHLPKPQSDAERKQGLPQQSIGDSGVYNYHKCLKAILNRAVLFGKITDNPYNRLRGKFKRGDRGSVEYLTAEEMAAVESLHPVEGTQMAVARDLFVFQMHTGLSYADTQAFDFSQYHQHNGHWVCVGNRIKTGVQYIAQLSDECERILQRYGWTLPKIDNADYNHCLKALGAAVGIEKPLHSHLARHSFATFMAASDVPIQRVSKMLGHASIVQTQRYAKVLPENVFADFNNINLLSNSNPQKS